MSEVAAEHRPDRNTIFVSWMKTQTVSFPKLDLTLVQLQSGSSWRRSCWSPRFQICGFRGGGVKASPMAGVVQGSCKMLPSNYRLRLPSICLSSPRAASKVDPPNIAHLCEKARLTLTPEEVKDFEPQIGRIVDWFAQLQDIDLTNVPPAVRVGEIDPTKTLRPDTAKIFADREAMLASAPDRDGPFLKVPKIMKENQE